ncbi:ABC transporter substrate-binding protein [Devosia sp. FJ2-5-3]|uniref:ABC transporter substrate-binding protein n=1 Tax=Devosia sp. FJ2-5-3 TaxID=2976680 RepID=UPI0023D8A46E|nr:ABC transporter substrate-binding protein [Devosia sp. FJ2-5-3]WEJ58092.1 ABC transporter substrate-binding protein [Devosia sp. FJ2-5-3]
MRRTIFSTLSLALSASVFAFGGPAFAQSEAQSGGVLRIATYEPLCLDQNEGSSRNTQTALQDVYDRLVYKTQEGEYFPWLASEWSISEDGLTYTFTIRDGVVFHDGTTLDAEAVRINLQRWVDDRSANGVPVTSVTADGNVVTITLSEPHGPLLHDLSEPVQGIVAPSSIEAFSKEERCAGGPDITIGSGPFKVVGRTQGQDLILERFEDYNWPSAAAQHTGPAYLERIEMRFLTEDSVRVGAVESGQADIAAGIPAISVAAIEGNSNLQLIRTEQPGIPWSMWVNQSKPALADQSVREAIRIGVDYSSLVNAVFLGTSSPAYSAITPGIPAAYDAGQEGRWSFDAEAAKALLDKAGWSEIGADGIRVKDGERLSLKAVTATNWNNQQRELFAQGIQAGLQAIGIEYSREVLDFATVDARMKANEYDLVDTSQSSGDGATLLFGAFQSTSLWPANTNWGFVDDAALDDALNTAVASADPTVQNEQVKIAQKIINDGAYLIPIANPQVILAASTKVKGTVFSSSGQIGTFYDVWLEQ